MRHLTTECLAELAAIYDDDVELVSVVRAGSRSLEALAAPALAARHPVKTQWIHRPGDSDFARQALLDAGADESVALAEEITLAGNVLCELLGCEAAGVRVTTLSEPMCPRFHVDRVPCRMLITIAGPGTEWIASDEVDPVRMADRDTDAAPTRDGGHVSQVTTGSWSLLKGGAWDVRFRGVVHRSPHQKGGRLLLSLDPLFEDHA